MPLVVSLTGGLPVCGEGKEIFWLNTWLLEKFSVVMYLLLLRFLQKKTEIAFLAGKVHVLISFVSCDTPSEVVGLGPPQGDFCSPF